MTTSRFETKRISGFTGDHAIAFRNMITDWSVVRSGRSITCLIALVDASHTTTLLLLVLAASILPSSDHAITLTPTLSTLPEKVLKGTLVLSGFHISIFTIVGGDERATANAVVFGGHAIGP